MPIPKELLAQIKHLIPPLNGKTHKGQSGRLGVLGGAMDYTGAPFFACMSSMRLGVDITHAICSPVAGSAMKTYTPDLIVHPILSEDAKESDIRTQLEGILDRLHVLVIGPGLGREQYMLKYAKLALSIAREKAMYVVVDADGLWMVNQNLDLVKGYRRAVLTPNVMEFKRLSDAINIDPKTPHRERASLISKELGGVLIVQKGPSDLLATNTTGSAADAAASHVPEGQNEAINEVIEIDVPGGLKRCGGQGDILSGTIGGFLAWGKCLEDGAWGKLEIPTSRIPVLAAAGGCTVTRTTSRIAFAKHGRSVVTQDMLGDIANGFAEVFGEELQGRDLKQNSKI